jgi:hypothetical protein
MNLNEASSSVGCETGCKRCIHEQKLSFLTFLSTANAKPANPKSHDDLHQAGILRNLGLSRVRGWSTILDHEL